MMREPAYEAMTYRQRIDWHLAEAKAIRAHIVQFRVGKSNAWGAELRAAANRHVRCARKILWKGARP